MEKLKNIHPGEILLEEFLIPMEISAYRLAKETFLPQTRISEIIKGNRRITADTAIRFSKYFGTSAKFWLGLQDDYDLEEEQNKKDQEFNNIKPIENPLDKINKISGNTFDWNEETKIEHGYDGNDVGVIAQEIEEVLPQLVQTRESGYKAVKYDKLVALLIEGIKEQQIQINDMKVEIENLKRQKGL